MSEQAIRDAINAADGVARQPAGEATTKPARVDKPATFAPTDLGNAERLVARHGEALHYCHPWNRWLVWDGKRWATDATAQVTLRAKETTRAIYYEVAGLEDRDQAKKLAQHALRSESASRIRDMIALAKSEPIIPVLPEELDTDLWVLNVDNGTFDLRTGELRPHNQADMITKLVRVPYDPDAQAPTWDRFLAEIFNGNENLIGFVQRAVGYTLCGATKEQVFFYAFGSGSNGKSTFLSTLRALLGDYAQATPTETILCKDRGSSVPNDLARLKGARMVTAIEADEGCRLAESLVKAITSGDTITARFLHAEFFEFRATFKLWLAANHKITIRGIDHAIWRRIKMIPFEVVIGDNEQDHALGDKLLAELPGILAWAVRGCREWRRDGLNEPAEIRDATSEYRTDMDVLGAFLADCCNTESPLGEVSTKQFRHVYENWCQENGERPLSQKILGPKLAQRGFQRFRREDGFWWRGLSAQ